MNADSLDMVHFSLGDNAVFSVASHGGDAAEVAIITDDGFISTRFWADDMADEDETSLQIEGLADLRDAIDLALIWLSKR